MEELGVILVILLLIGPYSLLLYKKVGIRIRLLFISMSEIFILCMLLLTVFFGAEKLVEFSYAYNMFVWLSVLLNLILIFFSWLFEKLKSYNRSKN